MRPGAVELFKLRGCSVEVWPGYGVVMPQLATTNGSIGYTAQLVVSYIQRFGPSVITESRLTVSDWGQEGAWRLALKEAYEDSASQRAQAWLGDAGGQFGGARP